MEQKEELATDTQRVEADKLHTVLIKHSTKVGDDRGEYASIPYWLSSGYKEGVRRYLHYLDAAKNNPQTSVEKLDTLMKQGRILLPDNLIDL